MWSTEINYGLLSLFVVCFVFLKLLVFDRYVFMALDSMTSA